MRHELKTWTPYFELIMDRVKEFEIRKDDRGFTVGDELLLREYRNNYTGRELLVTIIYKLEGGQFGIEKGFCVLGIKL